MKAAAPHFFPVVYRTKARGNTCACMLAFVLGGATLLYASEGVRVELLDGSIVGGVRLVCTSDGVRLTTEAGDREYPWDELASCVLGSVMQTEGTGPPQHDHGAKSPADYEQVEVLLPAGGRLAGRIVGVTPEGILFHAHGLGELVLRLSDLAAIRLADAEQNPAADQAFVKAMSRRVVGHDLMIARDAEQARAVTGALVSLGAESGTFTFDGRDRSFSVSRVYAFVMAAGPSGELHRRFQVRLRSGAVIPAVRMACLGDSWKLDAGLEREITVPVESVVRVNLRQDRVVFLSELEPVDVAYEGRLHNQGLLMRDAGVSGRTIALGGRVYDRGLGMPSRMVVTYELTDRFDMLAATIGLDDYVRPRGAVVFRVLGDDRVLFDSGVVTGADAPRDIAVELAGVRRLALMVDFGPGLDLADHAVWAQARLIRPKMARD